MQLLDNDTFLKQLTALFETSKDRGSIWLTHKRLTHDGEDASMKHEESYDDTREYPCILKVTNGESVKISTHIQPGDLQKFYHVYGTLLKASMTTLRKRDKKREKQRTEQIAQRKKRMATDIVVHGPKRGNGRRKRQRLVKAVVKQQQAREKEEAKQKSIS